jgi:hypothetical protein|tara:strand:+ start:226 stop:525 length:300 start_codon:yes stop_codon:yes gene_type:complete
MNEKKVKALRKKIKPLQVEWLKTLLNEEEAAQVSIDNIDELAPTQDYYMANRTMYLSFMTPKWIMKYLKQFPDINSFAELSMHYEDWRTKNRGSLNWIQ